MKDVLFDSWTEKYDSWFATPVGRLVKKYEADLLLELLDPSAGERILDVGCGTGIFTRDVLDRGAEVTGIDLSRQMLKVACTGGAAGFDRICADMCTLPFAAQSFDKVYSMTAIEFVEEVETVIAELERVTRPGGRIVVTTLNSLSPWAAKRRRKGKQGHSLFQNIHFRSPEDMERLVPAGACMKTAIHFQKDTPVDEIPEIEGAGSRQNSDTGAFLAVQWTKKG